MLKNIKLFSTDSDRTTYESSASYETPYVSKVTADNSVHYNKPIVLITFTVSGNEFQAEQGMTWGEFINSSYNSLNLIYISDLCGAVTYIDRDYVIFPNTTETPIFPDEQIIQNINYSKALFPC